jgi:hypothetical protein
VARVTLSSPRMVRYDWHASRRDRYEARLVIDRGLARQKLHASGVLLTSWSRFLQDGASHDKTNPATRVNKRKNGDQAKLERSRLSL